MKHRIVTSAGTIKLARGTVALSAAVRGRRFDHGGFHRRGDRANRAPMSEIERTAEVPRDTKRRV